MHVYRQLAALKYGLILRKPAFLVRMASFYVRSFAVRGFQPLRYVDLAIGDLTTCNQRCAHCFATAIGNPGGYPLLAARDYRRIGQQCKDEGAIHLSLQGREPTIHPELEEIVRALKPRDILLSYTTNGMTATHENAVRWRSWGVDQLNVSIDSFDPDVHDAFRGVPGAFIRAMAGIKAALKAGLKVQINTTVGKSSLYTRGFRDLLEWCKSNRYILNLVLAAPSGNWQDTNELLDQTDMAYCRALVRSSPYIRQDMDSIQLGRGCPAMKEALYITPWGDVLCCPFIHVSFGNVHDETLGTIRRRAMARYNFLREHAGQCLEAEDQAFIRKYMTQTYGRGDLPARAEQIFDSYHRLQTRSGGDPKDDASKLREWETQVGS